MRLYEVYTPELEIHVRYKLLSEEEMEALVLEYGEDDRDRFARAVLESVIHNLKPEVTVALRRLPKEKAKEVLNALFTGALMINPGLDIESWVQISQAPQLISASAAKPAKRFGASPIGRPAGKRARTKKITKTKFLNLERHLKDLVVGQDEAIDELVAALKRSQVGLGDDNRPMGVFLFAGASGVGKTHLARELHNYLFGPDTEIVRVDCGEYQHKHENQKLIGSPPGYLGHEEGGYLTNAMMKNPQTVVLLDEVEKAHPDLFHTFLRVFDEGQITDGQGKDVNFKEAVIIMTTNLGNSEIAEDLTSRKMGFGQADTSPPRRERVTRLAGEAIRKNFRPEFINRIDKTVVFNHLQQDDYQKIAELELNSVQNKLEKRGFTLVFDNEVLGAMVHDGVSHVQGARGLAQLRRDRIENSLADLILSGRYPKGTSFKVSHEAGDYCVTAQRPASKQRTVKEPCSSVSEDA